MIEVKCFSTSEVEECFYENLFNDPRHVVLQGEDAYTYNLYIDQQLSGSIHFLIRDGVAYSPFQSLFGGFETQKKLSYDALTEFYTAVEADLIKKKANNIAITLPAGFYKKSRVKMMKKVLEDYGFSRLVKLKNHSIEVVDKRLSMQIHAMEKRKLKKCVDFGLAFHQEPEVMLSVVYEFIKLCRKEKKQPMSIEFEKLRRSFELFPDNYFVFTVKKSNEIFAATIAVKVNEKVFYNFLPASPAKFNDLSPTVKLIDGLYNYALKNGFRFLDLGVSTTSEGKDQKSLIEFKKRMGGQKSSKLKMGKILVDNPYWYA